MRLGVVFPQTEIGADPAGVRDYVQAAESLGYDHLVTFDHVIGANVASRPGWRGAYESRDMFHEPMVLFGYLAGLTQTLELFTGILILPQRQTVLAAKQAAAVDVLSKGRLRLGIGTGWNDVEYEALGENFHDRGRRSEEQIGLMRRLWTQEHVTYDGRWHRITDAGINPLPIQRPIPVWLGGSDDRLLDRVGRIGDGWYALFRNMDTGRAMIDKIRASAEKAGRDPGCYRHRGFGCHRRQCVGPVGEGCRGAQGTGGQPRVGQHDGRGPGFTRGPHRRDSSIQGDSRRDLAFSVQRALSSRL